MVVREFRKKLEDLINCCSMENGSDTPDWILAQYLLDCLHAFDVATFQRERWYGRGVGSWKESHVQCEPNTTK